MNIKRYQQNENLTSRVLSSLLLYLDDVLNPTMSESQRLASADAIAILIDAVLNNISQTIPSNVRNPVENIFTKTLYAVRINSSYEIKKCKQAITDLLNLTR